MYHASPIRTDHDDERPSDGDVAWAALTVEPAPAAVGERRLMRAVLLDAVEIYLKHFGATDLLGRRELAEVQRWFRSSDRVWPFAFARVCEALGLEPERVRAGLRAVRDQRLAGGGPGGLVRLPPPPPVPGPVDSAAEPPVMSRAAC